MHSHRHPRLDFTVLVATSLLFTLQSLATGQNALGPSSNESMPDLKSLMASVRQLQSQVQMLNSQVSALQNAQQRALLETKELRAELNRTREQTAARTGGADGTYAPPLAQASLPSAGPVASEMAQETGDSLQERVSKLEDEQDLMNGKIDEQSQTKVESGSKYRVRLSGIVLLNSFATRGSVDNLDFPQIATPPETPGASGSLSGSLRQSQIAIEAFGPDLAGAHTSANLKFDFAGGFPDTPNGAAFGVMRLRTGTIRFDWQDTSVIAGQDSIFVAPLTPTTLDSLAIPALSYTGNLWSWTPQIRIEHRVELSDGSRLLLQAGVLDSLTGDVPQEAYRYPTAGEQSGQPAYATRVAWSRRAFDRDLTVGVGGYFGRQNWGFGKDVDGWAGMTDLTVPLGNRFDLAGEFYRGRSVGGLGGGVGQSLLLSGPISDPGTTVRGLDSMGGWIQLKFKPRTNLEINFAYGQDNPFASELRSFPGSAYYYGSSISRNLSPFVNFIYRVRSDVLFSVEYRRLQTYILDSSTNIANQTGISLGYLF